MVNTPGFSQEDQIAKQKALEALLAQNDFDISLHENLSSRDETITIQDSSLAETQADLKEKVSVAEQLAPLVRTAAAPRPSPMHPAAGPLGAAAPMAPTPLRSMSTIIGPGGIPATLMPGPLGDMARLLDAGTVVAVKVRPGENLNAFDDPSGLTLVTERYTENISDFEGLFNLLTNQFSVREGSNLDIARKKNLKDNRETKINVEKKDGSVVKGVGVEKVLTKDAEKMMRQAFIAYRLGLKKQAEEKKEAKKEEKHEPITDHSVAPLSIADEQGKQQTQGILKRLQNLWYSMTSFLSGTKPSTETDRREKEIKKEQEIRNTKRVMQDFQQAQEVKDTKIQKKESEMRNVRELRFSEGETPSIHPTSRLNHPNPPLPHNHNVKPLE